MKNLRERDEILVALSGGVDSAVAALLLKERGFDVQGIYFELLSNGFEATVCQHRKTVSRIAEQLDIKIHFVDRKNAFKKEIIPYFIDTYRKGLTPNPCVFCNPSIKFKEGLAQKERLGLRFFATGHYARIELHDELGYILKKGVDPKKDQSYFLHRLPKIWFENIIFPLGSFKKDEIRQIATDKGLDKLVLKESQEICFVEGDYRESLTGVEETPGPIILKTTNEIVGTHKGLYNYTIGQRRGIGIPGPEPYYVLELDTKNNALIIGTKKDTLQSNFYVENVNWLVPEEYARSQDIEIKIRFRHNPAPGRIVESNKKFGRYKIMFYEPQSSITPGQAAVFYAGDVVLGGGVICV